jgi:hypothetical protein
MDFMMADRLTPSTVPYLSRFRKPFGYKYISQLHHVLLPLKMEAQVVFEVNSILTWFIILEDFNILEQFLTILSATV